jgi:F-type H+-transporting ATPase subunit b
MKSKRFTFSLGLAAISLVSGFALADAPAPSGHAEGHAAPTEPAHAAAAPHGAGTSAAGSAHATGHGEGGGAGHGAAGHGEGHDEHGPGAINWTDFSNKAQPPYVAALINFALLIFIFVRFGRKPIADALVSRKNEIAKDIEEAAKQKKEAEARAKKYQASLANLDQDLETTRKALEEAGRGERDRLIAEAKEKAERMKRDATFLLDQENRQAELDLTRELAAKAVAHAEDVLRTRVTAEDHERLVAEFLADLSKKPAVAVRGGASA